MEKDYFRDRPIESTIFDGIRVGDEVLICEKDAQKYAKEISDLTYGTVIEKLTKHNHPRGIKVKISTLNSQVKVGRIVYIVNPNKHSSS